VLVAALAHTRERRHHLLIRLREIKDLLIEEAQENLVTEEAASFLFQLEIFEEVPGVGMVSGALLNYGTLHRVERAARHVFQERWLHEQGKVVHIEPAHDARRLPVSGDWAGIVGRAAYHGSYYVGFGAAFPVYAVAALLPRDNALARGVKEGAVVGRGGVTRLVGRLWGAFGSRRPDPAPVSAQT
ncbi:MAG: EcsC family protein, partial [Isosphaeraceae bacterium]|nr:EcsC family protein [Isosphaeraceae bacterium]